MGSIVTFLQHELYIVVAVMGRCVRVGVSVERHSVIVITVAGRERQVEIRGYAGEQPERSDTFKGT